MGNQEQQGGQQHTQGNGVAHPALQPSRFVNVEGPVSPSTGKQAGVEQASSQAGSHAAAAGGQSGFVSEVTRAATQPANPVAAGNTPPGAALSSPAQPPVEQELSEEDDLEVPQEIEEAGAAIACCV